MSNKPNLSNQAAQREIDKAEKQFDEFDKQVKELTLDRMNEAKKEESEPQTKLSQKELDRSKDIYLKPLRTLSSREKFNEKYRDDYNFAKEYVQFIAEHKEIIGEKIEIWTKAFPGVPAEYWEVPTNKPVWGPRYLAEQIKGAKYHRLRTEDSIQLGSDGSGNRFHGGLIVDSVVQRLDAQPLGGKRSVFMNASGF